MALSHATKTVGTTAVALNVGETSGQRLYLFNNGTNEVYLGTSAVTAAVGATQGVTLAASASLTLQLDQGDILYAICAAAESATVGVLSL